MVKMQPTTTVVNREMFTCMACGDTVMARMSVLLVPSEEVSSKGEIAMTGEITGVQISHDCIPKTTR